MDQGNKMQIKPILSGLGTYVYTAVAATVMTGGMAGALRAQEADPAPAADPVAADPLRGLEIVGAPHGGGIGFQPSGSSVADDLFWLDTMVLWIIAGISLFVTLVIIYIIFRFNSRANPRPAQFSHNSPLEVAWTIVPVIILVFIGAFSLPVLFKQVEIPEADLRIKVTGYQWFWGYEYPDIVDADGNTLAFDSYMIGSATGIRNLDEEISAELAEAGYTDAEFLLATDTAVVVPVGATVVMTVTAADVIHSWAIPAFGVKQDAVPGRLAELWFDAQREGTYFGQCSELCGQLHAYMPITVKVVSQEAYDEWVNRVQTDPDYYTW